MKIIFKINVTIKNFMSAQSDTFGKRKDNQKQKYNDRNKNLQVEVQP